MKRFLMNVAAGLVGLVVLGTQAQAARQKVLTGDGFRQIGPGASACFEHDPMLFNKLYRIHRRMPSRGLSQLVIEVAWSGE